MTEDKEINKDEIIFYFDKNPNYPTYRASNHQKPKTTPAFVLALDKTWNDYFTINRFDVFFYKDFDNYENIGKLRIIELSQGEEAYNIEKFLPDSCKELTSNFASLGENKEYYEAIYKYLHDDTKEILRRFKDCTVVNKTKNLAKENYWWSHSLMRSYDNERAFREAISIIVGKEVKDMYKFSYHFEPPYSKEEKDLNFLFDEQNIYFPRRIYALIGKNGVGKTQLLSSLPNAIINKDKSKFSNNYIPPFSKIIIVSTSYYDKYKKPIQNEECEYKYCGILDENNNILSIQSQKEALQQNCDYINKNGNKFLKAEDYLLSYSYKTLLQETKNILKLLFKNIDIENDFFIQEPIENRTILYIDNIIDYFEHKMSSGESILLYNIFNIIANISFNSLLFFDEPETHLHPNAITELIAGLSLLLQTFESFAIVATHSPLVIREIQSESVLILKRSDNHLSVAKIEYESLGASVNKLNDDIFKNKETEPYYIQVINKMHSNGLSSDQILKYIENEKYPVDLRIFMYIKSLDDNSTTSEPINEED